MTPFAYLKKIISTTGQIAKTSGYSHVGLLISFTLAFIRQHISIEEFEVFRLYEFSGRKHSRFLSFHKGKKISDFLNRKATKADYASIGEKHKFNQLFREFIQRDWLYLPESSSEDIRSFIARNPVFLAKPSYSMKGYDIHKFTSNGLDIEAFLQEYQEKPFLLESYIRQHPDVAAINPTSVNTIRIVTAQYKGHVKLVGGGIRCGGTGSIVDNFHQGGIAYPLDLETGIVCNLGRSKTGETYIRHPSTGMIVPGFQVPHWDVLLEKIYKAALFCPRIGYVGWDIAVTQDGVDFVECNINYPGITVIQLDMGDVYYNLKTFIKEIDKKS